MGSSSPIRPSTRNDTQQQQATYISVESTLDDDMKSISRTSLNSMLIIPSFQRSFPAVIVAILGFIEFCTGFIVLALELFTFDFNLGLWYGGVYALAGAAIIIFVIGTDRERHQASVVLIFQFVALMFTIIELILHSDLYRKRCVTKTTEPVRELTSYCQIILIQMIASILVLVSTIIFSVIYFRVTLVVLKQPYGTFNMSNAINITAC